MSKIDRLVIVKQRSNMMKSTHKINLLILVITFVLNGVNGRAAQKIKGGTDSMINDYPFLVMVKTPMKFCTGVLISSRHALTVAQCLTYSTNNRTTIGRELVKVIPGQHDMENADESKAYPIAHINVHGTWLQQENYDSLEADIAVITLKERVPVRSGDIPERSPSTPGVGTEGLILGWGSEEAGGKMNPRLQEGSTKVIDHESCKRDKYPELAEHTFCTQSENHDVTICDDDFGDPFINDWGQIAGIGSHTTDCTGDAVNVFTDISPYKPWIQRIMSIESALDPNIFAMSDKTEVLYEKY